MKTPILDKAMASMKRDGIIQRPRKLKISRVWIEHKVDENPDLSYLGEYSNEPRACAIERENPGRGYKYFNPARHREWCEWNHVSTNEIKDTHAKVFGVAVKLTPSEPEQSLERMEMIDRLNAHYRMEDYRRMEAYNESQWHMIGVIAKCEIVSPAGIVQTLRSGGLWGIESDSGADYLKSIEDEQLQELRAELLALGIGERAISHAFKNARGGS